MKFVWEEKDIQAGVRYSREGISEVWIISWMVQDVGPNHAEYLWSSTSLEDGMTTPGSDKANMVRMLNEAAYVPVKFMGSLR